MSVLVDTCGEEIAEFLRALPIGKQARTRQEAAVTFWERHWHEFLPLDGRRRGWVLHAHWRGLTEEETKLSMEELLHTNNSLHFDLRLEFNKEWLWGRTIPAGRARDNLPKLKVETLSPKTPLLAIPKLAQPHCIAASTLVVTERGFEYAGNLSARRIFGAGRLVKIQARKKNKPTWTTWRVRAWHGLESRVTGNHPFWTQRGWVYARDLKESDWLFIARPVWEDKYPKQVTLKWRGYKKKVPIDQDFLELVGLFVGDGCIMGRASRVAWFFSSKEEWLARRTAAKVERVLQVPASIWRRGRTWWVVCEDAGFAAWLRANCYAQESDYRVKQFPLWSISLPAHLAAALLQGFVFADGCHLAYEKAEGWQVSNVSQYVIGQAWLMLLRLGILPSLTHKLNGPRGRRIFVLRWSPRLRAARSAEGGWWVRVRTIERRSGHITTYDFQTEDETISLVGALTHNSWLDVGKDGPYIAEPTEVGATKRLYAKFFALDWGEYEMGSAREHMHEVFIRTSRKGVLKTSRTLFQFAPLGGRRQWIISQPSDQRPYAKTNDLEEVMAELKQKGQRYLIWGLPGEPLRKFDLRKESAEIIKSDPEKRLVWVVVMKPYFVDHEGQWASPETIEDAAHKWVLKGAPIWLEHTKDVSDRVKMVESYTLLDDLRLDGRTIRKGSWIAVLWVPDDAIWKAIKSGKLKGGSIRGFSKLEAGAPPALD